MFKKIIGIFLLSCFALSFSFNYIFAEESAEVQQKKAEIAELENKIANLQSQKDTLTNQVNIIQSQVNLTQLKINQTEESITMLEVEIHRLSVAIGELDVSLNKLSSIFIEQINQNYKFQKQLPFLKLIANSNFNNYLQERKYILTIQKSSQDTLISLETARSNYDIQKQEKETKQAELEELQTKLASQREELSRQKKAKEDLLTVTKNNEANYQKLKQAALAELSALLAAKFTGKRDVQKGDLLGMMGNTGYSFGDHLHFGLYDLKESEIASWTYVNDIDPLPYMNQHIWPMTNYRVTQYRGHTPYAYLYSDRFHHGIDMVSSNGQIMAINDGVAYFYRNPGSSLGNHVKLFHPDGKMTLYLHMK